MATGKTLIVKLTDDTPQAGGPQVIQSALGGELVRHTEPVFPDESEPDLATLFSVSLSDDADLQDAIATLTRDQHVQYAHTPQPRK